MSADIEELLRTRPLFAAMSAEGLSRLAAAARRKSLAKGQRLFEQGDVSDAAYVLIAGSISIGIVGEDGSEVHFADLHAGAVFGEAAVIDGGERTAGAAALTDAALLMLPGDALMDVAASDSGFALALMRDVVAKLRAADAQIEDRSLLTLEDRLAKFLSDAGDGGTVDLTQAQIADRLGVSREAVNRRLKVLVATGAVELARGKVLVLDTKAL